MYPSDRRTAFNSPGAAGLHAPKSPETVQASVERPRRFDPAAACGGSSYPIPALSGYRVEASSRHFA
ncbi:hypothetical protein [Flaviaesturariibacter aridisoli]|uniref:Uncharacterized protein n=1 Tax=Flaviaesturariibacter aridisoli TaxID=2545761 RepID=A0A4R4DXM6_9BACT|nr:hypothetical protein [Flaviaesturariibacter aridisoli]TCZ69586.1 hypothetical protein E0486_12210 [Flaviaesturariibacter aridisoli]